MNKKIERLRACYLNVIQYDLRWRMVNLIKTKTETIENVMESVLLKLESFKELITTAFTMYKETESKNEHRTK